MEEIVVIKRSRATTKGKITRVVNAANNLMRSGENLEEVKGKLSNLEEYLGELRRIHEQLASKLEDEWELEEADVYYNSTAEYGNALITSASEWIAGLERIKDVGTTARSIEEASIQPSDSASQHGSKRSSTSTALSLRLRAAAKKAALEAEENALGEKQAIEEEELKLRQKKEKFLLRQQIEIANAEEAAVSELSGRKTVPSFPATQSPLSYPRQRQQRPDYYNGEQTTARLYHPQPQMNPLAPAWDPVVPAPEEPAQKAPEPSVLQLIQDGQQQQQRLLEAIHLPKAELTLYDGDPLKFWVFLRAFENTVDSSRLDENGKLTRLLQYCTGRAKKVIECCSVMPPEQGYVKALKLLKDRFGNEHTIAEAWLKRVTQGPPITPNDMYQLREFADDLKSCSETLKSMGHQGEISSQHSLASIVDKLPYYLKTRWLRKVREFRRNGKSPTIEGLVDFVDDAAEEATDPVYGYMVRGKGGKAAGIGANDKVNRPRNDRKSTSLTFSSSANDPLKECPMCHDHHNLFACDVFKGKRPDERFRFAKELRLCYNCLLPGHMSSRCQLRRTCSVAGCGRKHTKFLHQSSQSDTPAESPSGSQSTVASDATCGFSGAGVKRVALPIVAVKVWVPGRQEAVSTFALLDNCSTSSFCTDKLASQLGASGQQTTISLSTLEKGNSVTESTIVSLRVSADGSDQVLHLPSVYTKAALNINDDNIARYEDVSKWSHLSDLVLPTAEKSEIGLLIGQDVPEALMPLEVRMGGEGAPYAVRTKLGWTINGPLGNARSHVASVNFVRGDVSLENQVQRFWKLDASEAMLNDDKAMSVNDKRALSVWENSIRLESGHYEVSIPFKSSEPRFPQNEAVAERRLQLLKKRLDRDPELHAQYKTGMQELLDLGYAEPASPDVQEEPSGAVWYLPHHPVYHPRKPDKVRIVFDCAATHKGTSLNDEVLQGPDLNNKLLGVLLRFRREPVALMADVKAMFHQVKVPPGERDVLRFLWWPDGDTSRMAQVYRMTVHLFGGTWSPSCCSFALRHTALENTASFKPETVKTVLEDFYVDDCLTSVDSEDKAISLAGELREMLARGGFSLTKWLSNSHRVVKSIPTEHRASEVKGLDFNFEALPTERALGVFWDVELDCLGFRIAPKEKPVTKRGILSIMSSTYDPQGFVSPYVLKAKLIIQELSRRKIGWDEAIPNDLSLEWRRWKDDLSKLDQFRIDRCLRPKDFGEVEEYQLHHFADASQVAYGAMTFLKTVNVDGKAHVSLLMTKSRLAPIKTMTIPRLELSAATLSMKMDTMIRRELGLPLSDSVFWTDSMLVLQYIRNVDTRFHTFVANRISAIHEGSSPSQWRHIDTKMNPADDISRGLTADELLSCRRWLRGPEFLELSIDQWPREEGVDAIPDDDQEVKRPKTVVQSCASTMEESPPIIDVLLSRRSSWASMKKDVAWILRARNWLLCKARGGDLPDMKMPLTVDELRAAESSVLRYVQHRDFPEEMKALKRNEDGTTGSQVKRSSPLYRLSPFIGDDGLIRVGGRLGSAPISDELRHPVVLPKLGHVADLIIRHYHQLSGHSGQEYVLSLIRERFWMIKARQRVRKVLRSCVTCKRQYAKPSVQKMASLPVDRVSPSKPPFTYVGVDYFGPFLVKVGRSQVKRYGCLFTCLATRAIHIEVSCSLDTDSFMNALQRFVCRRGVPEEIRSDNGTNFVGAQRELKRVIQNWNQRAIDEFLLQKEIKWKFNPPYASHMGGVWERQIRTVRKLVNAVCREQVLDDEGLSTLMCIVESIVNGRPITVVSSDPKDPEPLTPNHLLLLRSGTALLHDDFVKEDAYCRKRWRRVQYLANLFWRRWVREYLPTLQQRQKWVEPSRSIQVGDVVIVVDESLPRNAWLLGRVMEAHKGADQLVRSVKVQTKSGTVIRPITKLCLLESVERAETDDT